MIIKKIAIVLSLVVLSIALFVKAGYTATEGYTLKAGVSMIDKVPKSFFGTWRVVSKLADTNSAQTFKPQSVDLWNLSRENDVLYLSNPFSGANASISIELAEGNLIRFKRRGNYDTRVLTDTVGIRLNGNTFSGYNDLTLETLSSVDKHVIKTERAKYTLTGEKITQ